MELELRCETVNCFESVLNTTVYQEETQEAIVPDACPDILRILDTRAQAYLTGKQVRDGMATVSGLVRANVFYLPEQPDTCVRHLEITIPFTCQSEAPGLTSQATVLASPRLRWAEARPLNPRKVLLRVDLAVEINAYQPNGIHLCCAVESGQTYGIEQLVSEESTYMTAAIQEKPFTFSDRLELGASGQDTELLSVIGVPSCSECKLIGSKLIFKGDVDIEALVCEGGELRTVRQAMTFSQIMEISDVGEGCCCEVRVALTDLALQRENRFSDCEVTVELLAQAVVRERRTLSILRDLYSTGWHTETTRSACSIYHALEDGAKSVPVRELMETTTLVRTLSCCWCELGEIHMTKERDHTVFTADVHFAAIYLDDAEQFQSVHKVMPVQCRSDSAGDSSRCWCSQPRELFVSPAAGGLEVRFVLEFHCLSLTEQQVTGIQAATLGNERQKADASQPSVILRLAAPGERLWDIAKAYATTAEQISQANELEDGSIPRGKMLLIPRIR